LDAATDIEASLAPFADAHLTTLVVRPAVGAVVREVKLAS
jgi:hypothetical protein